MLHGLASLFAGMSLAEELHTICFTAFVFVGTVCLFVGPENPPSVLSAACVVQGLGHHAALLMRVCARETRARTSASFGAARAPRSQAHAPPHGVAARRFEGVWD